MSTDRSPSAASSTESACSPTASTSPVSSTRGSARSTPGGDRSSNSASPASPSSTMSEPSEQLLLDLSMSSPAVSPARAPRPSASSRDSATPRPFCGARCGAALASFDPDTSSSRTWRTFSPSMTEPSGERFSGTWPRSGSMSSGTVFPLRPSAPLTDVTGSSPLLGTPTAHPRTQTPRQVDDGSQLANDLVRLLPTPVARTNGGAEVSSASREGGRMLEESVKLLPTPVANDDNKSVEAHLAMKQRMKGGPRKEITSLQVLSKKWAARASLSTGPSTDQPSSDGKRSSGLRLHPSFVEWMMGIPLGWSSPDCPLSATEFRSKWATSPGDTSSTSSECAS